MRSLIFVGLLFAANTALADTCDPRPFLAQDVDIVTQSDYVRLMYMSTIDKESYDKFNASHHGGMTIPYINVPMKGDFEVDRENADTLRQLLGLDYTKEETSTVLGLHMNPLGVDAYRVCLNDQRVKLSIDDGFDFQPEFVVKVVWNPAAEKPEYGTFVQPPMVTEGTLDPIDINKVSIPAGKSIALKVTRSDVRKPVSVTVNINNNVESIHLPPAPSRKIVVGTYTGSFLLHEHSDNSTKYGPHEQSHCWQPDQPNTMFVVGTAKPVITELAAPDMGNSFTITSQDKTSVCGTVHANSNDATRAGAVTATVSVTTVSSVEIK
jgi:hypothetical protein